MCKLCFLPNICKKLNDLNLTLTGENLNVFTLISKIKAFMKK